MTNSETKIIVKETELPKSCADCTTPCIYEQIIDYNHRSENCPLIVEESMTPEEAMCWLHNPEDEDCYNAKEVEAYNMAINTLKQVSKTGYWISGHKETGALGITYTEKICSNCGWNHSLVIPENFCPNCGIKMSKYIKP